MTRRLMLLFLPLATRLRADSAKEVEDLIASAANGLSSGKPEEFMEAFDPNMPGFEKLRDDAVGLTSAGEISCSLEVLRDEGDDSQRTLEIDWILRLEQNPGSVRRQKTVKCQIKKIGKKWRIVSLEPLEFFTPPGA
jgi:hypothetical protein